MAEIIEFYRSKGGGKGIHYREQNAALFVDLLWNIFLATKKIQKNRETLKICKLMLLELNTIHKPRGPLRQNYPYNFVSTVSQL